MHFSPHQHMCMQIPAQACTCMHWLYQVVAEKLNTSYLASVCRENTMEDKSFFEKLSSKILCLKPQQKGSSEQASNMETVFILSLSNSKAILKVSLIGTATRRQFRKFCVKKHKISWVNPKEKAIRAAKFISSTLSLLWRKVWCCEGSKAPWQMASSILLQGRGNIRKQGLERGNPWSLWKKEGHSIWTDKNKNGDKSKNGGVLTDWLGNMWLIFM